ncbi:hypothetical protein [Thermithiobacillus plumbiphilus]|uniref:Uncharacterized protein n=1 Tax=Thermithiobacillus plumbiphilus TaxID=1729899 RepID=A0ABU9DA10_9PROT
MEKKQNIEKLIQERPDLFDDMDCRPGHGSYPGEQGDEIMDSILPDWRERVAARQAKLAERKKI